jgi:hypothetical protein
MRAGASILPTPLLKCRFTGAVADVFRKKHADQKGRDGDIMKIEFIEGKRRCRLFALWGW